MARSCSNALLTERANTQRDFVLSDSTELRWRCAICNGLVPEHNMHVHSLRCDTHRWLCTVCQHPVHPRDQATHRQICLHTHVETPLPRRSELHPLQLSEEDFAVLEARRPASSLVRAPIPATTECLLVTPPPTGDEEFARALQDAEHGHAALPAPQCCTSDRGGQSEWQCARCTLINTPDYLNCMACFETRPASASASRATRTQQQPSSSVHPPDDTSVEDCSICLRPMVPGEQTARTSCAHVFHSRCISEALRVDNRCPLCRRASPMHGISGAIRRPDVGADQDAELARRLDAEWNSSNDGLHLLLPHHSGSRRRSRSDSCSRRRSRSNSETHSDRRQMGAALDIGLTAAVLVGATVLLGGALAGALREHDEDG